MFEVINLNTRCNNRCIFCFYKNEIDLNQDTPFENIEKQIKNSKYEAFDLFGGEPTLHSRFFDILEILEENNKVFSIASNMRIFSSDKFLSELYKYRNLISVRGTLLGRDAKAHDYYTQSIGSFSQTVEGIKKFKQKFKQKLMINTVVLPKNYLHLDDMYIILKNLGVDHFKYSLPEIDPESPMENPENLFINIKEVNKILYPVVEKIIQNKDVVYFEKAPFCLMPFMKNFEEFKGSKFNTFAEKCNKCIFKNKCIGVNKAYYEIFGENGVVKIE